MPHIYIQSLALCSTPTTATQLAAGTGTRDGGEFRILGIIVTTAGTMRNRSVVVGCVGAEDEDDDNNEMLQSYAYVALWIYE